MKNRSSCPCSFFPSVINGSRPFTLSSRRHLDVGNPAPRGKLKVFASHIHIILRIWKIFHFKFRYNSKCSTICNIWKRKLSFCLIIRNVSSHLRPSPFLLRHFGMKICKKNFPLFYTLRNHIRVGRKLDAFRCYILGKLKSFGLMWIIVWEFGSYPWGLLSFCSSFLFFFFLRKGLSEIAPGHSRLCRKFDAGQLTSDVESRWKWATANKWSRLTADVSCPSNKWFSVVSDKYKPQRMAFWKMRS